VPVPKYDGSNDFKGEKSMTNSAPITLSSFCICTQFKVSDEKLEKLKECLEKSVNEDLHKSLDTWAEGLSSSDKIKIANLEISGDVGSDRKDKAKPSVKFSISATDSVDYEMISNLLPFFQESIDIIQQYGISDIRFTSCTQIGFNFNKFKPLAQFPLPTDLPLNVELTKKLGKARLTTFGMDFEESPIGLNKAEIEYDDSSQEISVTLSVSLKPTSLDNIVAFSYENMIKISKLFVVERNE
jgi:hypothetical protein